MRQQILLHFSYSEAVTQCDVTRKMHVALRVFNMYCERC